MSSFLSRISLALVLFISSLTAVPHSSAQVLEAGEELTYSVSYLGIRLGTIKMYNDGVAEINGRKVYKIKAQIDSRDGIPFVEIHTTFESWIDPSATNSLQFEAHTKQSEGWVFDRYVMNYANKTITTEKWMNKDKLDGKQITITKKYNDGCSLFYCARQLLYSKNTAWVPTIVGDDTSMTKINYFGKIENIEIDGSSYPIRTVYFDGNSEWTGVYGVTGYFQGWFSDDNARIPIKAKMKLYLGSATIELTGWKRKDWQPPQGS